MRDISILLSVSYLDDAKIFTWFDFYFTDHMPGFVKNLSCYVYMLKILPFFSANFPQMDNFPKVKRTFYILTALLVFIYLQNFI